MHKQILVFCWVLVFGPGCGEEPWRGLGDAIVMGHDADLMDTAPAHDVVNGLHRDAGPDSSDVVDSSGDVSLDASSDEDTSVPDAPDAADTPDAAMRDDARSDSGGGVTLKVGPNMLANPSFEGTRFQAGCHQSRQWTLGSSMIVGEDLTNPEKVAVRKKYTAIDATTAQHGSQSCRIAADSSSKAINVMEQNGLEPIEKGRYYYVEGFMKTKGISGNRGVNFVEFYKQYPKQTPIEEWAYIDLPADSTQPFTRVAGIVKTPARSDLKWIGLKTGNWRTAGEIWIDAFSVGLVTSPITETHYQAEDALLGGGAVISGGDAVKLAQKGAFVQWTVNLSGKKERTMAVRWKGTAQLTFAVGKQVSAPKTWRTIDYAIRSIHRMMDVGQNTVRITRGNSGSVTIDKLTIFDPS